MIAHLGMYDLPALREHTDIYWQAIRDALGDGPDTLTRAGGYWDIWQSPDLLLSQTCGYPYRAKLHGRVTLVATPDYGLPGCPPGHYNSVIIAHADDPRTMLAQFHQQRFAFNEPVSQSGWAAPMTAMQALSVSPGALVRTGAHHASAKSVADGTADFAAIDAVTWKLLREHDDMNTLREITRTTPTPGLPYITAKHRDPGPLRIAIRQAIVDLPERTKAALHLHGLTEIPPEHYLAVPNPPTPDEIGAATGA